MDLHAGQIQGFFNIPVDNLYGSAVLLPHIRERFRDDLVMVSPDAGGVPRARAYAKRLHAELALIDKRRPKENEAEAMHLVGDVTNKTAVILDDMVDTAGTLVAAARTLAECGARECMPAAPTPFSPAPHWSDSGKPRLARWWSRTPCRRVRARQASPN